jgi:hypothetical protein
MGTTLTGTTPATTYDSLIKVTDNGPLSGTAKYLSDGLGNDSVLALSTAAAGIGTTTIVSGTKLTVGGPLAAVGSAGTMGTFETSASACFIGLKDASGSLVYLGGDDGNFLIQTPSSSYSTKLTLTDAGNVGIGTSAPAEKLDVYGNLNFSIPDAVSVSAKESLIVKMNSGNNQSSRVIDFRNYNTSLFTILQGGGVTFNGDTAAANALDDYEEGTWTMGVSFDGASVGVTTSVNSGTYTKIGRQVTVNGYLILTSKGSSVGNAQITGLPFTIGTSDGNYGAASLRLLDISFANQFQGIGLTGSTSVALQEITEAGVGTSITDSDFQNDSRVIISLTYFV